MIPEAAVEAAAKATFQRSFGDGGDWGRIAPEGRADYLDQARAALEAAAPHLQSRAWEEGYGLGYSDHMWGKGHEPRERNPYRPTP